MIERKLVGKDLKLNIIRSLDYFEFEIKSKNDKAIVNNTEKSKSGFLSNIQSKVSSFFSKSKSKENDIVKQFIEVNFSEIGR